MHRGQWFNIYGGGGSGQERQIYGSTPYSPASATLAGVLQVLPPFTPAPSLNSTWEVHGIFSAAQKNLAIQRAIQRGARLMLSRMEDYANITNSPLLNGTFHRWANGAAAAPDEWTESGAGTIARSTNFYQGLYAAALTNTAANAYSIYQDVPDFGKYGGVAFSAHVLAHVTTADRVRIQVTDGVNTFTSDYADGTGFDDEANLKIDGQKLAENLTRIRLDLRIETGGAITATFMKAWIQVGTTIFEYGLPALAGITDVYTEGTQDGVFDARIPRRWWDVNREVSPRRLVLAGSVGGKAAWSPVTGKVLKIVGQAYPTLPSTETTNVVVDPEYVLARAALNLVEGLPREQRSTFPDYGRWLRDAEQMEARGETRLDPDAIQVEPA
jgi:hypothetical protein